MSSDIRLLKSVGWENGRRERSFRFTAMKRETSGQKWLDEGQRIVYGLVMP